jgi:hypothetical protein
MSDKRKVRKFQIMNGTIARVYEDGSYTILVNKFLDEEQLEAIEILLTHMQENLEVTPILERELIDGLMNPAPPVMELDGFEAEFREDAWRTIKDAAWLMYWDGELGTQCQDPKLQALMEAAYEFERYYRQTHEDEGNLDED